MFVLLVASGCSGTGSAVPSSTAPVASGASSTATATPTTSPSPTPSPALVLPPGVPSTYIGNEAAGDVPIRALVPKDATVSGSWFAPIGATRTTIVVVYARGSDPLRAEHGLVVWSEFPDAPRWRAVYGLRDKAGAGVLGIGVSTADATGDRVPDVLSFEATGGSGGCGTYRLLSLADLAEVFVRDVCDTVIEISSPAGLTVTEAVFGPGDPHCCPSAQRVTTLRYSGTTWKTTSKRTIPLAP